MKTLDDIFIGEEFQLKKSIGKYLPILYAGASGDFNFIHIDKDFAKMVGLPTNILQGLCTMAFCSQMCTDWLGNPKRLKKLKVRFSGNVLPGDEITIKGKVTKKEGNKVSCDIVAVNQRGEEVITRAFCEAEIE